MVDFHEEIKSEEQAKKLVDVCVKEIEARTRLRIRNKPSVKMVDKIEWNPYWYSAYSSSENTIFLRKGADCTNIVHELIHANTDLSSGYDFGENFAYYFTFLTCESLHKGDRPPKEDNIRDYLGGIGMVAKIRGLVGEELFRLLVTDFYAGLNVLLKAVTGQELNRLETRVLKFLVDWSYSGHITFELYEFTPENIAERLKAPKKSVAKTVEKLKKLGLIYACNYTADSAVREKTCKLCEQYAKIKNTPLAFFYR